MGNLTVAAMFVIVLNVFMFLGQVAVLELNEDAGMYFTNEGTLLDNFDSNSGEGEPVLDTGGTIDSLPSGAESVSPTTGNVFTDTFSSIKDWMLKSTGLAYLFSILAAPYNILKSMNLPNNFVYAMGTLWYAITFILVLAFIFGRDS